jgi:hypothetical protein
MDRFHPLFPTDYTWNLLGNKEKMGLLDKFQYIEYCKCRVNFDLSKIKYVKMISPTTDTSLLPDLVIIITILIIIGIWISYDKSKVRFLGLSTEKLWCAHPKKSRIFLSSSIGTLGSIFTTSTCSACGRTIKTQDNEIIDMY